MTAPFVAGLRSRPDALTLAGGEQPGAVTIRVEMPETWDVVRIRTGADTPMLTVKEAALQELHPGFITHSDFVLKLNGFMVLDEAASVSAVGARDGSIFLLTYRRRRPVR